MKVEKQITGTTVALLLASVVVVGAVIVPTVMRIRTLTEELSNQQMEIERQYALRNYVKQTLTDIETAQSKLETIKATSILQSKELEFIQSLEHAAGVSGVQQEINLETVNEIELTLWEKEIPLKLRVQGPFQSVMSWLNEVEHLDYYVLFDSISISTTRLGGIANTAGYVDALFTGRVFWISEEAPYFEDFTEIVPFELDEEAEENAEETT